MPPPIDNRRALPHNRAVDILGLCSIPFLVRPNFVRELRHLLFWSTLAGLVEGQFAAVVAAKVFNASEGLIAVATATPTAANLFSLVWGLLCVGRRKIRLALGFGSAAVLCTATIGAIPSSEMGAYWFVAQVAAAQVMLAGVVTVRSAIWKSNYPHKIRGLLTARLQSVRFVVGVLTALAAARWADRDPRTCLPSTPESG